MTFNDLEGSALLNTGATKMLVSRELIRKVPNHQLMQHTTVDVLQMWLPYGNAIQSKGKVTLETNIEKPQVTLEAPIPSIT